MSRAWLFQANPRIYDVDAALQELDRIWWRAPQYTSEIRLGDIALIWRSGKNAGIVGLGVVEAEPVHRQMEPEEKRFIVSDEEGATDATRALLRILAVPLVRKERVAALATMADHPIVRAPMGTVFPLTTEQWDELASLLPDLTEHVQASVAKAPELPSAFSWEQRTKSMHPMPGGYTGYLNSVHAICSLVEEHRPTTAELGLLLATHFGVSTSRGQLTASFLRKVAIVDDRGTAVTLSHWTERWQDTKDDAILVALLHGRVRFFGEMLSEATNARTVRELLAVANNTYDMGWSTQAQIDRRRGWLQSAGMLNPTPEGALLTSPEGERLLHRLELYSPRSSTATRPAPQASVPTTPKTEPTPVTGPNVQISAIVAELAASSTDTSKPDRFERAVRDAFQFLGFEAQWMGGSGKTDVLLDASLGRDASYRVIIDCKTSGAGAVSDQQIDWITLREHKAKHDARYVAVVAPSPTGKRIHDRASEQDVTLISVENLVALCMQHSTAPLGLDDYERLFSSRGLADIDIVAEIAEEWLAQATLAHSVVATVRKRSVQYGPLTARDVLLVLDDDVLANPVTEPLIAQLLETLAHPVIGLLAGSPEKGYISRVSAEIASKRMSSLGCQLASPSGNAQDFGGQ